MKKERTNMKMIKMNSQNKQYYSAEFIKGWEQGVKDQYEEMSKDILEQIQSSWTPIAELEPNTIDHVLVTYKWSDDDYEVSEMDYWVTKYGAEHGDKWCEKQMNHVIAWREKPKPYKEKR